MVDFWSSVKRQRAERDRIWPQKIELFISVHGEGQLREEETEGFARGKASYDPLQVWGEGLSEEMAVASLSFLKLFVQGKTDDPTVIYHRNPVTELRHLSDFIAHYFSCITQEKNCQSNCHVMPSYHSDFNKYAGLKL